MVRRSAGALGLTLVAALAAVAGLLQDLDRRLSASLSTDGTRVVCTGVKINSWSGLSIDRVQLMDGQGLVVLEGLRVDGVLMQAVLPGPDGYRMTGRMLSIRAGGALAGDRAVQLGAFSADVRLDLDSVSLRAIRLGPEGRIAGGLDASSGRLRRAHLSIRLDKELRERIEPLGAVFGGSLRGESRLRLVLMSGRLRIDGAQRPLLDLTWAAA